MNPNQTEVRQLERFSDRGELSRYHAVAAETGAQTNVLSAGIKHRSTEHNSSLMMSESELDSDQDTTFAQHRPVRSRNRISPQAARNGNAFG